VTLDQYDCDRCRRLSSSQGTIFNGEHLDNPNRQWPYCPNTRREWIDHITGEIQTRQGPPCRSNYCTSCGPANAQRVEDALHIVKPATFFTINDVGTTPKEVLDRMTRLRRVFREQHDIDGRLCYFVEPHLSRPTLHVHGYALQAISPAVLVQASVTSRMSGDVNAQRVHHHAMLIASGTTST